MAIKSKYAGVHIPVGCTLLVGDDVSNLVDLGVIPEDQDSNIKISYDMVTVQGSKLERVLYYIKNMKVTGTTALYQIRLEKLNQLYGGIMKVTSHPGTKVEGEAWEIPAGFELKRVYLLPGQNADGSAPAIKSAKSGTAVLAEGTDYQVVRTGQGWGVMILTNTKASKGTAVDVTYDYTPAEYVVGAMGSGSTEIQPKVIRFEKEQGGKKFQVTMFSAVASNGLQVGFPGSNNDKPTSVPVEIEGNLDPNRAENERLLEIHDEIGVE